MRHPRVVLGMPSSIYLGRCHLPRRRGKHSAIHAWHKQRGATHKPASCFAPALQAAHGSALLAKPSSARFASGGREPDPQGNLFKLRSHGHEPLTRDEQSECVMESQRGFSHHLVDLPAGALPASALVARPNHGILSCFFSLFQASSPYEPRWLRIIFILLYS